MVPEKSKSFQWDFSEQAHSPLPFAGTTIIIVRNCVLDMSYTRGINVITLSIIMILSGCFGLTDDAEADSSTADEPNAAPVIEVFSMSDLTNCDTTGCDAELYHAVVDPDGDLLESGWDLDLDGTIDELVLSNRGTSSLSIADSELINTEMMTDVYTDEGPCYNNQSILTTTTIISAYFKPFGTLYLVLVLSAEILFCNR